MCQQLPGGYAIHQIIKLGEGNKYAVGTWGNGLHIVEINLTTYEFSKVDKIYL